MALSRMNNPQYRTSETIIGSNSILVGVLTSEGNIQIDGIIEGEVATTLHVHVNSSGRVRADMKVNSCTINGSVVGNIHASNEVIIESSARVWGQIESETLQVQPGAVFKGSSQGADTQSPFK